MSASLATLRAKAAELGATVEHDPQPDERTTCYQVIAPDGYAWKVGPTCIRVEYEGKDQKVNEIKAVLADIALGLVEIT